MSRNVVAAFAMLVVAGFAGCAATSQHHEQGWISTYEDAAH